MTAVVALIEWENLVRFGSAYHQLNYRAALRCYSQSTLGRHFSFHLIPFFLHLHCWLAPCPRKASSHDDDLLHLVDWMNERLGTKRISLLESLELERVKVGESNRHPLSIVCLSHAWTY